jgi:outer membrane immunogenic protein
MKKILLAGVATAALAVAAPANAADLRMPVKAAPISAPAPYFSWTGCYVGVHVGYGWGHKDFTNGRSSSGDSTASLDGNVDTSGGLFGGQVGCNYQLATNNLVIGIEGSFAGANIDGHGLSMSDFEGLYAKTDFLGSITGRLGWNGWDPRVLFYIRGGWAFAHDTYTAFNTESVAKQDRDGWVFGAGVEWAFAPSWSAFAEYDHYDFGTKRATFLEAVGGSTPYFSDVKQVIDTVKVGVNYRFNLGFIGKSPGRY